MRHNFSFEIRVFFLFFQNLYDILYFVFDGVVKLKSKPEQLKFRICVCVFFLNFEMGVQKMQK